jgi:antitoxin YefM
VSRVHDHHERVTVTVHEKPSAVLVAVEDLERLEDHELIHTKRADA